MPYTLGNLVWREAGHILGQYDLDSEITVIPKATNEATENYLYSNCLI